MNEGILIRPRVKMRILVRSFRLWGSHRDADQVSGLGNIQKPVHAGRIRRVMDPQGVVGHVRRPELKADLVQILVNVSKRRGSVRLRAIGANGKSLTIQAGSECHMGQSDVVRARHTIMFFKRSPVVRMEKPDGKWGSRLNLQPEKAFLGITRHDIKKQRC